MSTTSDNVANLRAPIKRRRKHELGEVAPDALWIRREQFFRIANVGPTLGDQMIRNGLVKSVKVGQSVLIEMESVRHLGRGRAA